MRLFAFGKKGVSTQCKELNGFFAFLQEATSRWTFRVGDMRKRISQKTLNQISMWNDHMVIMRKSSSSIKDHSSMISVIF